MIDTFTIIAEFSIGLAGFSGVVALVGNVPLDFLHFRIRNLLFAAFTPGFVALSGILLLHLDIEIALVVRLTSALLAIVMTIGMISGIRLMRKLGQDARGLLNRGLFLFNMTFGPLVILLQILSAAIHTRYAQAILVAGLILVLLSAAITFSYIIGILIKARYDSA